MQQEKLTVFKEEWEFALLLVVNYSSFCYNSKLQNLLCKSPLSHAFLIFLHIGLMALRQRINYIGNWASPKLSLLMQELIFSK